MTPETTFKSPRGRPFLTVTIGDGTSPSPVSAGKVPYLADTITPKTRRVSRLPANEVCRNPLSYLLFSTWPSCLLVPEICGRQAGIPSSKTSDARGCDAEETCLGPGVQMC